MVQIQPFEPWLNGSHLYSVIYTSLLVNKADIYQRLT